MARPKRINLLSPDECDQQLFSGNEAHILQQGYKPILHPHQLATPRTTRLSTRLLAAPYDFLERVLTAVATLKEAVKSLQEEAAKRKAEHEDYLPIVLLGQTAYTLDEVATDFVFRSDERPRNCSFGTLRNLAADNDLTPDQMLRWKQLKTYMSWQGWTVADLVGVLGELRTHQYPLAHGSKEQQESATPVMVEEWLNRYYGPDDSMHSLIKLISKFTLPGKPLCKSPHSREIIENELKKTSIS